MVEGEGRRVVGEAAGAAVDYLLIGHVCLDETAAGVRLGGTVAYAGLAAQRQGWRVGIVTSAAPGLDLAALLPGIAIHCVPASTTTRFCNSYRAGARQQRLLGRAAPLGLADVPVGWQA